MHLFEVAQGAVQQDQTPGGQGSRGHQSWQLYGTAHGFQPYFSGIFLVPAVFERSWFPMYRWIQQLETVSHCWSWVTSSLLKLNDLFTVGPISAKKHPSLKFFHRGIHKVWFFFPHVDQFLSSGGRDQIHPEGLRAKKTVLNTQVLMGWWLGYPSQ